MPPQPRLHLGVLVGGIIVGDQMQGEIAWRLAVDLLEKRSHPTRVWLASVCANELPVILSGW